MAKYLNSQTSFIVNGLTYEQLRSDSNIRVKHRPLPPGLKTCWELNTVAAANESWSLHLPSCGACLIFHQDKDHFHHLRDLAANHEAPYRYRCDTLWTGTVAANAKRPPVPTIVPTTIPDTETPPRKRSKRAKKAKVATNQTNQTTLEAIRVVQMSHHPPPSPPRSPAATPEIMAERGKNLTAYLFQRLDRQEKLLSDLTSEKKFYKMQLTSSMLEVMK
jgi:hypothetical protein